MILTDRKAAQLLKLLEGYVLDSQAEGQPPTETGDMTVREVLNDLIGSLPSHETVDLPACIREITGD
jgi:hypothetical protein